MVCAWEGLLGILPQWLRQQAEPRQEIREIRLRLGLAPELRLKDASLWPRGTVTRGDLDFVLNAASRYSPWRTATLDQGFFTAPGGHRIGVCGEMLEGRLRVVDSLNIRVARDFPGIAMRAAQQPGNILILGAPGWGKTTLLRDLIRQLSRHETVAVVDERGELFPQGFDRGLRTDVLTGCPKDRGIDMVLRSMGPQTIAVDEITADTRALFHAAGCGVRLLATAHAGSLEDFRSRETYRPLVESKLFHRVLILQADQTYSIERMEL